MTDLWASRITWVLLFAFAPLGRAYSAPSSYEGSITEKEARANGRKLLKEIAFDIDGNGTSEVAIAESLADGKMRAAVLEPAGEGEERIFKVLLESSARGAKTLVRLEAKRMSAGRTKELLAVFEDPSPDETSVHVRILGATTHGIRETFAQTFFVPRQAGQSPAVVEFGDASPHFTVAEDGEGQVGAGDRAIVWVKEPLKLELKSASGLVTFVIGAYRTIFRYDRAKESYVVAEENELVEFLPPKAPSEVTATAQVGKIWGTAQPFWATDGDLDTSWSFEAPKGAVGQSLTVKFKEPVNLAMIRVVPGCAEGADAWGRHYRVRAFRIVLASGQRYDIHRNALGAKMPGVRAAGEFPLDGDFGAQVLVFLQDPQSIRWATLEILELEPNATPKDRRVDEACISEVSFHG